MNCSQVKNQLRPFLAGDLAGVAARGVRSHLAECRDCASSIAAIDRVELLPLLDDTIEPSSDLAARFRARLEARRDEKARQAPAAGGLAAVWHAVRAWSVPRQLAAAGALAGFLAFGIYLGIHREARKLVEPQTAEITIAQNLPLLRDMKVIENLDLLEDFDAIQNLSDGRTAPSTVQ
jgi:anti-sigma factor RsiW